MTSTDPAAPLAAEAPGLPPARPAWLAPARWVAEVLVGWALYGGGVALLAAGRFPDVYRMIRHPQFGPPGGDPRPATYALSAMMVAAGYALQTRPLARYGAWLSAPVLMALLYMAVPGSMGTPYAWASLALSLWLIWVWRPMRGPGAKWPGHRPPMWVWQDYAQVAGLLILVAVWVLRPRLGWHPVNQVGVVMWGYLAVLALWRRVAGQTSK